jgi:hypothetical protein
MFDNTGTYLLFLFSQPREREEACQFLPGATSKATQWLAATPVD